MTTEELPDDLLEDEPGHLVLHSFAVMARFRRAADGPEQAEAAEPDLSAAALSRAEHTGNPVVDSVLDSLEELDRLPPSEHVAVFEAAHERLRGALSDAGEPPADG